MGAEAVLLEKVLYRDHIPFEEAAEMLRQNHGVELSVAELAELAGRLPQQRGRPIEQGDEDLERFGSEPHVAEPVEDEERTDLAERAAGAVRQALSGLDATDRFLIRSFTNGLQVSEIARMLGEEQKPLYRRRERLLTSPPAALGSRGLDGERRCRDPGLGPGGDGLRAGRRPGFGRRRRGGIVTTISDTSSTAGRHPELETVAAFVDGRLAGDERRRMVEHLASCDDCQELVTETVLLLREPAAADGRDADDPADDDEESGKSPPASGRLLVPPPGRFRRALPLIAALTAAAGIALLLWTPAGDWILRRDDRVVPVEDLTSALPTDQPALQQALSDGIDGHGWPTPLGDTPPATPEQEATFQLGVRLSELDAALRAGDGRSAKTLTYRIESLLRSLELPPALARYYTGPSSIGEGLEAGATSEGLLHLSAEADSSLAPDPRDGGAGFVDATYFALGKWAAAAQLAVAAGDLDWFDEPGPRRQLRQLRRAELPADLATSVSTVVEILDAHPTAADLPRLRAALRELVLRGGGGE